MDAHSPILPGWPSVAPALDAAGRDAEAVGAMLRVARAMAQAGRRIELVGLDALIGRLCARSLDLPPPEGRRMVPLLAGLIAEIDALAAPTVRQQT